MNFNDLDMPSIMWKVRNERELQKVYANEMAAFLGISEKTYQRIEKLETEISLKQFLMLCQRLKRNPSYFIGYDNAAYFSDCHNSGNNNTYNISEPSEEMKQVAQALTLLIQKQLG